MELIELTRQALASDGEIHELQHALAVDVIHDVEQPKHAAIIGQQTRHEAD